MAVDDRCKRFILHTSFLSRFRDCIFLPLKLQWYRKETHVLHSYFEKRNMKSTRGSKFDLCEEFCDLAY